jgi:hypothetical protein
VAAYTLRGLHPHDIAAAFGRGRGGRPGGPSLRHAAHEPVWPAGDGPRQFLTCIIPVEVDSLIEALYKVKQVFTL